MDQSFDINKVFFFFPNQRIFINSILRTDDIIEIDTDTDYENYEIFLKPNLKDKKKKVKLSKAKPMLNNLNSKFEDISGLMMKFEELIYERNVLLLHSKVMEGIKKHVIEEFMPEFNIFKITAESKKKEAKINLIKEKFDQLNKNQVDYFSKKLKILLKIPESYNGDISFHGLKIKQLNRILKLFDSDEINSQKTENIIIDEIDKGQVKNIDNVFKEKDFSKNIFTADVFMDY